MHKQIYVFLFALFLISCQEDEPSVTVVEQEDPNWMKLEIPNGREAYAIAGDIDDTLLVTTWTKAYYSFDQGQTWHESKNFNGPVPGLYVHEDTIFSLEATLHDSTSIKKASISQYYTVDKGRSWNNYRYTSRYVKPIGIVESATGAIYQIKENITPVSLGASSYYINSSEVVIKSTSNEQTLDFPCKHDLINLYLDSKNRLYIAASGGLYEEESNTFYCCNEDMPAIIYVSRKAIP